jgi:hypothetical protein
MPRNLGLILLFSASVLFPLHSAAQFAPVGGLDCNGFSKIQKPLRPQDSCADPKGLWGGRFYDNGHYIGHDEPSIGFYSNVPESGSNLQWEITLPHERPLPATQSFENFITFWFGLALCDPGSFPNGPCIPASDANNPSLAGSAFLEMQFYPPGWPPFITQISCDATHWCASLHINSLEVMSNGELNPNCAETTNFAFIQRDGIPTGPPGFDRLDAASFTPNSETLLMNQGDRLRVTIKDVTGNVNGGVLTMIEDLSTGQSGFMIASAHNGYRSANPNTCAGRNLSFHPEYATARFGNFVPWAALQANVNVSYEIGHFEPPDGDKDDGGCFSGPNIAGCIGEDLDFDGTSYLRDWADGTLRHPEPIQFHSINGGGIGPQSATDSGPYMHPYHVLQFETEVGASESTCNTSNGKGCVVPPAGAQFYPFYSVEKGNGENCTLLFGNFSGAGINNFGGNAQWGTPNNTWFFGTNSGGVQPNPCGSSTDE